MDFKYINLTNSGSVAKITLNRPEVLNSFNKAMGKEVQTVLLNAIVDESIRAVLITGEGKAFCAGQDLAEAAPKDSEELADLEEIIAETFNPIIKLIRKIEKPVVCAVNGVAAGAGANIALACDIVVASQSASFIQAFSKIGLIPDSGGTYFLPRLVGLQKATAMMMLGDKITADEAYNSGMIYKVFPDDTLMEVAAELAVKLASMPTKALGLTKRALNNSFDNNLEEQLLLEQELQGEAGKTNDYREGIKAFLEKRKPVFNGN